jgi:hypothetical protein
MAHSCIVEAMLLIAPKTNRYSDDPANASLSKEEELVAAVFAIEEGKITFTKVPLNSALSYLNFGNF